MEIPYLSEQPRELLREQLLLLDLESINSFRLVSSEMCRQTGDLFWRGKLKLDFPEYERGVDPPRQTYYLLYKRSIEEAVRLNRPEIITYLLETGEKADCDAYFAVAKYDAVESLPALFRIAPGRNKWLMIGAAFYNKVELMKLLTEEYKVFPDIVALTYAFVEGSVEAFVFGLFYKRFITGNTIPHQRLMLGNSMFYHFFKEGTTEEKREKMKEMVAAVFSMERYRRIGGYDSYEQFLEQTMCMNAIIILDRHEMFSYRCYSIAEGTIEYIWRHGSKEMVKKLLIDGPPLKESYGLSAERLELLLELGAEIAPAI